MIITLKNYKFDKATGTVYFPSSQYLFLGGFLSITHVPSGTVIFDKLSSDKLGIVRGNALKLAYDTSRTSWSNTDALNVQYAVSSDDIDIERKLINLAEGDFVYSPDGAVGLGEQSLSLAQQAQARANIGLSLSPDMYGAAGDGTTDDTPAFARLSAAMAASGNGRVTLRSGAQYKLRTGGWVVPSLPNIEIDGAATLLADYADYPSPSGSLIMLDVQMPITGNYGITTGITAGATSITVPTTLWADIQKGDVLMVVTNELFSSRLGLGGYNKSWAVEVWDKPTSGTLLLKYPAPYSFAASGATCKVATSPTTAPNSSGVSNLTGRIIRGNQSLKISGLKFVCNGDIRSSLYTEANGITCVRAYGATKGFISGLDIRNFNRIGIECQGYGFDIAGNFITSAVTVDTNQGLTYGVLYGMMHHSTLRANHIICSRHAVSSGGTPTPHDIRISDSYLSTAGNAGGCAVDQHSCNEMSITNCTLNGSVQVSGSKTFVRGGKIRNSKQGVISYRDSDFIRGVYVTDCDIDVVNNGSAPYLYDITMDPAGNLGAIGDVIFSKCRVRGDTHSLIRLNLQSAPATGVWQTMTIGSVEFNDHRVWSDMDGTEVFSVQNNAIPGYPYPATLGNLKIDGFKTAGKGTITVNGITNWSSVAAGSPMFGEIEIRNCRPLYGDKLTCCQWLVHNFGAGINAAFAHLGSYRPRCTFANNIQGRTKSDVQSIPFARWQGYAYLFDNEFPRLTLSNLVEYSNEFRSARNRFDALSGGPAYVWDHANSISLASHEYNQYYLNYVRQGPDAFAQHINLPRGNGGGFIIDNVPMSGASAPGALVAPDIGIFYHDTSASPRGVYRSVNTNTGSDWQKLN